MVNNELDRSWKEIAIAQSKYNPGIFVEGLR
jgi:hypothetical protein